MRKCMSAPHPEADISIKEKTPTTGEVDGALERRVANVVPTVILARRYLVELYKMDSRVRLHSKHPSLS